MSNEGAMTVYKWSIIRGIVGRFESLLRLQPSRHVSWALGDVAGERG